MNRCRVFICRTCHRIVAGCLIHEHVAPDLIDSCAICAQDKKKAGD